MRLAGEFRFARRQFTDLSIIEAELRGPRVRILATIAPRCSPHTADAEIYLASGLVELFSDLGAGLRASHNQDCAWQKLLRIAVGVGVQLLDISRHRGADRRNFGSLIEARCNDNVARSDPLATIELQDVIAEAASLDLADMRSIANRQRPRQLIEPCDDLFAWHEAVGILRAVADAWQARLPSRRIERE